MAKKAQKRKEIRRVCNLEPSKNTEADWKFEDAVQSSALTVAALPPASKDLRASWWNVGDQGSTGSCVGWSSTDGVMRYHLVAAGKLGKTELLSPRFTWMASKETDEYVTRPETFIEGAGTSLKAAMDICRKFGVVTDALLLRVADLEDALLQRRGFGGALLDALPRGLHSRGDHADQDALEKKDTETQPLVGALKLKTSKRAHEEVEVKECRDRGRKQSGTEPAEDRRCHHGREEQQRRLILRHQRDQHQLHRQRRAGEENRRSVTNPG